MEKSNLINRAFIRFVAPDSRNRFYKHIKRIIESGTNQQCELQLITNGRLIFAHIETSAILDKIGNIKEIQTTAIDITERRQLENEREKLLKESHRVKDELSILIENIVDEVWFCNKQGDIILANAAARKFEQDVKPKDEKSLNGLIKSVEVYDSDGIPRPREGSPPLRSLNGEILTDLEEIIIFPRLPFKLRVNLMK